MGRGRGQRAGVRVNDSELRPAGEDGGPSGSHVWGAGCDDGGTFVGITVPVGPDGIALGRGGAASMAIFGASGRGTSFLDQASAA